LEAGYGVVKEMQGDTPFISEDTIITNGQGYQVLRLPYEVEGSELGHPIILMISAYYWNCRGALSSRFCSIVHHLRKVYGFDILALAEPRISCREQKKLLRSWALRIIIE
jgi:hypothetical protein